MRFVRYSERMDPQKIQTLVRERLESMGSNPYRAATDAGLPAHAIRFVLDGHEPKVGRAAEICRALGLEFYIGPPRQDTGSAKISIDEPDAGKLNEGFVKMAAQADALRDEITLMAANIEAATFSSRVANHRIREPELIIPTLILLATRPDGVATTRDIISHLEDWFQPSGEDAEKLKGRKDSRFSQIVRNMISHRKDASSFIRNGYAEYLSDLQGLRITDKGRKLLKEVVNEI